MNKLNTMLIYQLYSTFLSRSYLLAMPFPLPIRSEICVANEIDTGLCDVVVGDISLYNGIVRVMKLLSQVRRLKRI